VGRVYGYDNIKGMPPVISLFDDRTWVKKDTVVLWDEYEFIRERNFISYMLAHTGFSEVYNYSLISTKMKDSLSLGDMHELANPISNEYCYLRRSLLPRALLNVRDNMRFLNEIRIFETGRVFFPNQKEEGRRLAIVLARKEQGEMLFLSLKSVIDLLMNKLGIANHWYDDVKKFSDISEDVLRICADGKFAEIKDNSGSVLGAFGVLKNSFAEKLKIKGEVAVAELDLKKLVTYFQHEREFEPLPKYPTIIRDISVLIDSSVRVSDIINTTRSVDYKDIIEDIDVFDVYEPAPSERNKNYAEKNEPQKSIAFHVIFRAKDRTLTDREVESVEEEIKRVLQERLNAQIR